MANSLVEFNSF